MMIISYYKKNNNNGVIARVFGDTLSFMDLDELRDYIIDTLSLDDDSQVIYIKENEEIAFNFKPPEVIQSIIHNILNNS